MALAITHKVCDMLTMSRRPKDPGEQFSQTDIAIGTAMTNRAIQQLADTGLLPKGDGIKVLKRAACIGGFVATGAPLLLAGHIAKVILDDFNQYDGEVPSGLVNLDYKLPEEEIEWLGKLPVVNDYWRHRAARRHPQIYRPGEAFKNDALIAIVDRRLFFYGNKSGPMGSSPAGSFDFTFGGWIEGWERGDIVRAIPMAHRIDMPGGFDADEWNAAVAKFEREGQRARENAIGTSIVNISLAVRAALDRLADYRGIPEAPQE